MPETPQEPRHKFSALTTLAAVLAAFLLAGGAHPFPPERLRNGAAHHHLRYH